MVLEVPRRHLHLLVVAVLHRRHLHLLHQGCRCRRHLPELLLLLPLPERQLAPRPLLLPEVLLLLLLLPPQSMKPPTR